MYQGVGVCGGEGRLGVDVIAMLQLLADITATGQLRAAAGPQKGKGWWWWWWWGSRGVWVTEPDLLYRRISTCLSRVAFPEQTETRTLQS